MFSPFAAGLAACAGINDSDNKIIYGREKNKMCKKYLAILFCMGLVTAAQATPVPGVKGLPAFTGTPVADGPRLLQWPLDQARSKPELTDQSGDRLYDLHGRVSNCRDMDLILSTEGNYNMALGEYWQKVFLKKNAADIKSWYYTTSPPISLDQIKNTSMTIGNLDMACRPQVVIANKKTMAKLAAAGMLDGKPVAIKQTRGNVLLVKKGNPKHIKSIWDLGRKDVHVVTPNPWNERGAFTNYTKSIYHIAQKDPNPPKGWTADKLFAALFGANAKKGKWLYGDRIHHRDEPQAVAYGRADAAMIMYQLGHYTAVSFPDKFEIIPLGGSVEDPQPLPGSVIGTSFMARVKGKWSARQKKAQSDLWDGLQSREFADILVKYGMKGFPAH